MIKITNKETVPRLKYSHALADQFKLKKRRDLAMAEGELTNLKAENSKAVFGLNVFGKSENPIHVSQTRNVHFRNFNGLHNMMFHNKVKQSNPM